MTAQDLSDQASVRGGGADDLRRPSAAGGPGPDHLGVRGFPEAWSSGLLGSL